MLNDTTLADIQKQWKRINWIQQNLNPQRLLATTIADIKHHDPFSLNWFETEREKQRERERERERETERERQTDTFEKVKNLQRRKEIKRERRNGRMEIKIFRER